MSARCQREHDDIARRDQETADATAPYLEYWHLRSPDFDKNGKIKPGKPSRCILCNRPCLEPKYFVWEHYGGGTVVTREEGERLNSQGRGGGDLGAQPIGADCLRKNPQLKRFVGAI
jgi:hypothetical protein